MTPLDGGNDWWLTKVVVIERMLYFVIVEVIKHIFCFTNKLVTVSILTISGGLWGCDVLHWTLFFVSA